MRMVIVVMAMVVAVSVSAQETDSLAVLKQVLGAEEQIILGQYSNALDRAKAELKKTGNLDDYLVVVAEQKRLQQEKTVPFPAVVTSSLRPAGEAYHRARMSLLEKYVAALNELIKKEMQAERIESAKLVKAERDRAGFLLADLQSALPAKVTTEDTATSATEKPVTPRPVFKPKTYVDDTRGWAGLESKNNVYTFRVESVGRKAMFRFWASGDIGTGTSGQVLLTGPEGKELVIRQWQPDDFKVAVNTIDSYKKLTPITCNVSEHVTQAGDYRFTFKWGGSQVGLAILRVELELQ